MKKWIQMPGPHTLINISDAFKIDFLDGEAETYDLYAYFMTSKGVYSEYLGNFSSLDLVMTAMETIAKELKQSEELIYLRYGN